MASSSSDSDDDAFIRDLLGFYNGGAPDSVPKIDSQSINDEVARLEWNLSQTTGAEQGRAFVCPKCFHSFSLKHYLTKHLKRVNCVTRVAEKKKKTYARLVTNYFPLNFLLKDMRNRT